MENVKQHGAQFAECLPGERHRLILDRLGRDGRVVAQELAQQFHTSEDTIRRDLRELAAAGLCQRVYGGALPLLPLSPASTSLAERVNQSPERKQALGEIVAGLLPPGQVVFVDAGSTNLAAMRALPVDHELIVVTNSPAVAAEVATREGIQLILVGGVVDRRVGAAFGTQALHDVSHFRPDIYLLGVCAIDAGEGIAVFGFDEGVFKRTLISQSRRVIAAATSDKLGTTAPFTIAPAAALADLVLESDAPDEQVQSLQQEGVCIHRVVQAPKVLAQKPR